ncbi:LysR substrate-binding domain-containing protein [Aquabacterium sp. OR-4]|uniref:LysR substrate-binding domain-containing protein n=1 Tax=Aquabacterium sp. OR-4 TaxID=2978127 RepID=UPI0028C91888|nr:LysR substrate-binding domain-containing protein [Aquabacterium sp. OR-4]MDT7838539.1 LysR substrate-binding domain-containing protein [Aquabacterium sp. OR-4]
MDLRQLRYFVAVAEAGHMTRAAATLGLQQPPLSQQIRAIEGTLGTPLFLRHPRGVALTDAGRELLPRARRLLEVHQQLMDDMQRVSAGTAGVLAVGITSSAAAHAFTPTLLRDWRRAHPQVELRIAEASAAELTERVDGGALHAAFLRVPVATPPGLAFDTLLTEPAMLALPIDHALARRYRAHQPVPLAALAGERLILARRPGAPGLYANLLRSLELQGIAVQVVAEVDRMLTNLNLVASGEGLSLVPASMKGVHAGSVAYRALTRAERLDAPLTLVHRSGDASPLVQRFCATARETARALATRPRRAVA